MGRREVIRSLSDITVDQALGVVYSSVAAAVIVGALVGVLALLLSSAIRGGSS
jgi:hypothetical protein